MKILVTGGAGFIGSHIVDEYINNGHEVTIIDNMSHGKRGNINAKAKFYNIDVRDKEIKLIFEKEKFDVVCHHAAQISVPDSIENPLLDAEINILGSINILECSRIYGVKKVIYPASAAIFGEPDYLPIDEEHILNMQSGYGVSKHTIEHYLKVYNKLYGINYTILRYSNVYGPRQDATGEGGVVSIFCEKFYKNEAPIVYGDGMQTRDFIFVKDVANINLIALTQLHNDTFNICTNSKISILELIDLFNEITNKKIKPAFEDERFGDIKNSYMSYEKIHNNVNWKPKYSLVEGLKKTINCY